jgi:hypothetical protein
MAAVTGTCHVMCEFRQAAISYQVEIFADGSLNRTKNFDAGGQKLMQRAAADTTDHHGINSLPPQGCQRLTLTVLVFTVWIDDGIYFSGGIIDDQKKVRRAEVPEHRALQPLIGL